MDNKDGQKTATIIFVRGLPGSGKTFIAKKLQKTLDYDVVLLDPDATDYSSQEYAEHVRSQIAEGVDKSLHAYRYLRAQAYAAIEARKTVIWNQPFTNLELFHKVAARLQEYSQNLGVDLKILIIEVDTDAQLAKQRVVERKQAGGHGPSPDTFKRFVSDYKSFAGEGFEVVAVKGDQAVDKSVAIIIKALSILDS